MVFNFLKKKDPICGMKQEKDKGLIDEKTRNWFCCGSCKEEFYSKMKEQEKNIQKHGSCCH